MYLFCFKMPSAEVATEQVAKLADFTVSTFTHEDCTCLAVKHPGSLVDLTSAMGQSYSHDRFLIPEDEEADAPEAIYLAYQARNQEGTLD